MRIISKTNDYYDSAQAYGQDQSLVYVRKNEAIRLDEVLDVIGVQLDQSGKYHSFARPFLKHLGYEIPDHLRRSSYYLRVDYNTNIRIRRYMIGFCGQWYPCLEFESIFDTWRSESLSKTLIYPGYEDKLEELRPFFKEESFESKLKKFKQFLSIKVQPKQDLFHHFNTPILVADVSDFGRESWECDEELLEKDAVLADYQFYKVKDVFSAYQDISQYLSGVLGVGNPDMVQISDTDMRDAKGFHAMSFKKRPAR